MSAQMLAGCGIQTIFGWQNHHQAALLQLTKTASTECN
jgi:hypothetical protein